MNVMAEIFYTYVTIWSRLIYKLAKILRTGIQIRVLQISMTSSSLLIGQFVPCKICFELIGSVIRLKVSALNLVHFTSITLCYIPLHVFHFYIPAHSLKLCKHVFCNYYFGKATVTFISTLSHSQSHRVMNYELFAPGMNEPERLSSS